MPILFCNVGWMENYNGQSIDDKLKGGGTYVIEQGRGGETCNFTEYRGVFYGFVQPVQNTIRIEKIGANVTDEKISGVTVVWTAKRPKGGTVVVGWYKNATIYRKFQKFDKRSLTHKRNDVGGYWIKCKTGNQKLLPVDERIFGIPRGGEGEMGKSPIWYADSEKMRGFIKSVKKLIAGRFESPSAKRSKSVDPERNLKVERAAIKEVVKYFEKKLGYTIRSVEKDNLGWDLEAAKENINLHIEVKGLSGAGLAVELTPNEYLAFFDKSDCYRLCIVNNALTSPSLKICRYSIEANDWIVEGGEGASLVIAEKKGASINVRMPAGRSSGK